jgi:hypothetical protein
MFSHKVSNHIQVFALLHNPSSSPALAILALNSTQVSEKNALDDKNLANEKEAFKSRSKIGHTPVKTENFLSSGFIADLDMRYPINSQKSSKNKQTCEKTHSFDRVFTSEPRTADIYEAANRNFFFKQVSKI